MNLTSCHHSGTQNFEVVPRFFGKFVHPGIINTNNTLKLFNLYDKLQMFLLKFFFH